MVDHGARPVSLGQVGGFDEETSVSADAAGYQQLLAFARAQVPGRRCWAVEGVGSYGAGLAGFLQARVERVVEVARPKRPRDEPVPRAMPWTRSVRRATL